MDLSAVKSIAIPEGKVLKIEAGGVTIWRVAPKVKYTNRVPLSINTDGSIYNGSGYKDGFRIRSGGAEAENSHSTVTGFIPVSPGDVIRISGCNFGLVSIGNAINVSNDAFTNIGQITTQPNHYGIFETGFFDYGASSIVSDGDGVWKWIVPPASSGVAYIRITAVYNNSDNNPPSANLIVTVNEEIA